MYSKEIKGKNIIYSDGNNKIEVLLNEDSILDVDNIYNLDFFLENKEFLEYVIKDIQKNYNRMYYLSKEYKKEFEDFLVSYNFKIMTYKVNIPYQNKVQENKLVNIKNKYLWEEYMLKNINEIFSKNALYLENAEYKESTKEHLSFMVEHDECEALYINDNIIGSVCYNLDNGKNVYIRDIYADNKELLKDIILMLETKYQKDVVLDVIYMYKDLLEVINELNGKIINAIYCFKK